MPELPLTAQQARVLVVEDDPNNRLVVVRLLQLAGVPKAHIFEAEGDPVPFLRTLSEPVDVILLDLQLPKKDGYSILQELRADPEMIGLLVIALTANVMRPDVERARSAGFDGFIGKPIDGRRFSSIFNRLLAGETIWLVT